MAAMSSRWSFDPRKIDLTEEVSEACGLDFEFKTADRAKLFAQGVWWVLPFAQTREREPVGVRLVPGRTLQESPIVEVHGHEVWTIASRPAHYLPVAVFQVANSSAELWATIRGLDQRAWSELDALHRALGGQDGLATLRAVLDDDRLRQASAEKESKAHGPALAEAFQRLDPSPETVVYRSYLLTAQTRKEAPLPLPQPLGVWEPAAADSAYALNAAFAQYQRDQPGVAERLRLAAWTLLRQPAGLDCFQFSFIAQITPPRGKSHARLIEAAQKLVEQEDQLPPEWKKDGGWPAVQALGRAGSAYDAKAHLEAAEALRATGEFERVFMALTSAEFWRGALSKQPFPQLAEAARLLSQEHGWDEIAEAISSTIEAGKEYIKEPKKKNGQPKRKKSKS